MLVSILSNLVMQSGVVPPITRHNVPDSFVEEKGGSDGRKLQQEKNKLIQQDEEEILLLIAGFIRENNKN